MRVTLDDMPSSWKPCASSLESLGVDSMAMLGGVKTCVVVYHPSGDRYT